MPESRCPSCDAPLPTPGSHCPRCLLLQGLESDPPGAGRGANDRTVDLPARAVSLLETIGATIGGVPRVMLRDTAIGETPSPVIHPTSGHETSTRYRIDGEIARGGMGSILKGRDPDLGRDVAIKVLREDLRENSDLVRRFVEEAQIGGQLQHPGVVPIYELGTFADLRPFFSMKLVKGQTLADLLGARPAPAGDLPRFLSIFEAIAQTMAYSHTRGVIHRDLKPSNVMVGSFGEVQVMDWGLAKVLARGGVVVDAKAGKEKPSEPLIATARSGSDLELSHAGSILGTPSYMPPEQARGETDLIDERADVFAMGSILAEILTGAPAFTGRTSGEILHKAARGDTADALARLDGGGAEAELIALVKDCLAVEPEDRPHDGNVVADRITAYLAGVQEKLRTSERERAVAEAKAVEERKERRLQAGLAAAVLALMAMGGGGYAWNQQQKAERVARTAQAVDEALADAARLRGEAQAAPPGETRSWADALAAARRAERLLAQGETDAPLKGRVTTLLAQLDREQAAAAEKARQLEADRALLAELESVRGNRADHLDPNQTDAEYAAAFRKAGLDLDVTEPAEAGRWLAARSEPVELAGYIDDWAYARRAASQDAADWRRLVAAARGADPDPWRDGLRKKFGSNDAGAVAEFRRLADDVALEDQPAAALVLLARQLKFGGRDRKRAVQVLRRAARRHPGDFRVHFELALAPGESMESHSNLNELYPDPAEAVRHLTAAVGIRPRSVSAHVVLAMALTAQEKLDDGVAECREAIRLKPDDVNAHSNLGNALRWQGKLDEAVAECREAIRLKPDYALCHSHLGLALREQGKHDEAIAEFREAIRLKPDYVAARDVLVAMLGERRAWGEILTLSRQAIERKSDDPSLMHRVALTQLRLGDREGYRRTCASAIERFGRSEDKLIGEAARACLIAPDLADDLTVPRRLAEFASRREPELARWRYVLGLAFYRTGDFERAIENLNESVKLSGRWDAVELNWPVLAMAHHRAGHEPEAREWLTRARATRGDRPRGLSPTSAIYWWHDREEFSILLREAEVLIEGRSSDPASLLPVVLRGELPSGSAAEAAGLAYAAYDKALYVASSRFFAEAFAADPKLAETPVIYNRYNAACSAALAAAGQGKDDRPPDDASKARLRGQALGWLKDELATCVKVLEAGPAQTKARLARTLEHWKVDADLAGIRDAEALSRLPEAERKEWQALWADVETLLKRAEGTRP